MGPTQKAVGITGASGLIGRALCLSLADQQHHVVAWTRDPEKLYASFSDFERSYISCLPYHLGAALRVPEQVNLTAIVHAAVDLETFPLALRDQNNRSGAQSLLDDSLTSQAQKIIFLSSFSAHAQALSHYGRTKFEIEKLFLAHPRGLVVRPGLVLGPSGVYAKIAHSLEQLPIAPIFWNGTQPVQTIPLESLIKAILKLIQANEAPLREWNLAHPNPLTLSDFYREICKSLGTTASLIPLPGDLVVALLRFLERLKIFTKLGSEQLLGLKASRVWPTETSLNALQLEIPSFKDWLLLQNQGSLPRTPQIQSDTRMS